MDRESNWSTAGRAAELELIRYVLEMQIEYYQLHGRWPSAQDVQRQLHGQTPKDDPPNLSRT